MKPYHTVLQRDKHVRKNCDMILSRVAISPTEDEIRYFMKQFINMRFILEQELTKALRKEGESESEIISFLDKLSGRAKFMTEMESRLSLKDISESVDSYSSRVN